MIRCFDCKHFKPVGKNKITGWCINPVFSKKERVGAVDYCDKAEKKEDCE